MSIWNELQCIDNHIEDAKNQLEKQTKRLDNLLAEKERKETLLEDYFLRGFAISEKTQERINNWKEEHKKKCSCWCVDYIFTPTELGTALNVVCPKCGATVECNCSSDAFSSDDDYDLHPSNYEWKV